MAGGAVERGRITRHDAEELVTDLLRRGRKQTGAILADLEELIDRGREEIEARTADGRKRAGTARKRAGSAAERAAKAPQVDRVVREVDEARRAVGVGRRSRSSATTT